MITSFEELSDVLAKFENRIATLENLQPYGQKEEAPPTAVETTVRHVTVYDHVNKGAEDSF